MTICRSGAIVGDNDHFRLSHRPGTGPGPVVTSFQVGLSGARRREYVSALRLPRVIVGHDD